MQTSLFFFRIKEYIKYRLEAKGIHSIHSPFLFELYKAVIQQGKDDENKDFYTAEAYRDELLATEETITKTDFGAGPGAANTVTRQVLLTDEVESSAVPINVGRLLYRLVTYLKPKYILELGTNAGISTYYMLLGMRGRHEIRFYTIEGCKDLKELAENRILQKKQFWADLPGINFLNDTFENSLPKVLNELPQLDFALIDGDHRKEKVLQNFNLCAAKAAENSIFVIDDIRWSPEMLEAWETIVANPKVTMSLDMYNIGLVFFNPGFTKQHIKLKW